MEIGGIIYKVLEKIRNAYFLRKKFKLRKTKSHYVLFLNNKKIKLSLKEDKGELRSFFKDELPGYLNSINLKNVNTAIDCGAYHGYFSISLHKLKKDKPFLVIVEPNEVELPILMENLKLNNIKNYILIKKGLSDKKGKAFFRDNGPCSMIEEQEDKATQEIDLTTIDDILKENKIPYSDVSLVKMDVEGAEVKAIDGAENLIKEGKAIFSLAVYHYTDETKKEMTASELTEKFLNKKNYNSRLTNQRHITLICEPKN